MSKFGDVDEAMELLGIPGLLPTGDVGTEMVPIEPLVLKEIESNLDLVSEDFRKDYELVRQSYHYQQQMILDAAKIALQNAKINDAPRMMEVFSSLMNTWSATNRELLKMHKELKEIQKKQDPVETPTTINNTQNNIAMVGTPADVLRELGSQFDQVQLQKEHIVDDIEGELNEKD